MRSWAGSHTDPNLSSTHNFLVATLSLSVQPQVGSGCPKWLIKVFLAAVLSALIQLLDTFLLSGFVGLISFS